MHQKCEWPHMHILNRSAPINKFWSKVQRKHQIAKTSKEHNKNYLQSLHPME